MSATNNEKSQVMKYMKVVLKAGKANASKAKKVSGYNVFSMESRKGMDGTPGEIMAKLGGMWKKLSEAKQKAFNEKAEKMNAKSLAEFEEPETDSEFEKLKGMIEATIKEYKKQAKKGVSAKVSEVEKSLDKCTVAELKAMCKERKLAMTGTKTVLLERLSAPVEEAVVEEEVAEEEAEEEVEEEVEEEAEEEAEEEVDLEKCSVAELKNLCKERDLSTTGTRAVLMKRIMEAEGVEDEE
jgi:galactitol-specific phosphotransferase system IIB component